MSEDDLYARYMAARTVHRGHRADCGRCTDTGRCPAGQTVFESFARLQDAYLNRQHQQRR
ncbi:hypothetical protein [Streptomyces heilongjiangensis]|uniref:Uncharacterized protein n=1 Tax=Streptomyces heilongjiangensis TaxID=945052 RepID=A0ABW1BHU6_9ACTN|nr:hypothetical protein [Streptomyces heilongjiangensis]MDC2951099.1 hypothetical protein [Streptomyces heilongjiangensis]